MDILIVVDMQNDFVTHALGTPEAVTIVPAVKARINAAQRHNEKIIFTRDTHPVDYLSTQEGINLPIEHCIKNSEGWQIIPELADAVQTAGVHIFDKPSFGSIELASYLQQLNTTEHIDTITLIGLCTDICVISNALLAKAALPEARIVVEKNCCAGVTPQSHERALAAMETCQIIVQ
ncbi:cysteine hydrolase family protein [Atopobium fossor]|uniref:cysteine hydrolase family protein n=1 Tax=Atopobium fossor TaxID=39487 RepID=UPI0004073FFE|nr:isochorismatase family cysteine hydrolase [Atopobium fossor]